MISWFIFFRIFWTSYW